MQFTSYSSFLIYLHEGAICTEGSGCGGVELACRKTIPTGERKGFVMGEGRSGFLTCVELWKEPLEHGWKVVDKTLLEMVEGGGMACWME